MAQFPELEDGGSPGRRGARGPAARVPGERNLGADACDRHHARPAGSHAPASPRMGDDGGERRARRPCDGIRIPLRMRASPLLALATLLLVARRRGRARWVAAPLCWGSGRRRRSRLRPQSPDSEAPCGAASGRPRNTCTRSPGKPGRTSTRSSDADDHYLPPDNVRSARTGASPTARRHQHRSGSAVHPRRARSRLHRRARNCSTGSIGR